MNIEKPKDIVWFLDTSALITLAVHEPLHSAVIKALSNRKAVLMGAVVRELEDLTSTRAPVASWAKSALQQLEWLGQPVALDDPVGTDLAVAFQEEVSAGRPLTYPGQQYGEAAIVAAASRAQTVETRMLSDDYDARVLALNNGVTPLSVHRLLHTMIAAQRITVAEAASYAKALTDANRSSDYTADELKTGRLGRAGQP